jgi:hypothetical protein
VAAVPETLAKSVTAEIGPPECRQEEQVVFDHLLSGVHMRTILLNVDCPGQELLWNVC